MGFEPARAENTSSERVIIKIKKLLSMRLEPARAENISSGNIKIVPALIGALFEL